MDLHNDPLAEPSLFSAMITPHRSLGSAGFLLLMLAIAGFGFVGGVVFFVIGAWPVVGFLGIDVALVYWAFRLNYRAAGAYEEVHVTPSELTVRKVSQRGEVAEWRLNPRWVRLDRETHAEYGIERLFLVSHGKKLGIAGFLGPTEKESFAKGLAIALVEAKRGPTRNILHDAAPSR